MGNHPLFFGRLSSGPLQKKKKIVRRKVRKRSSRLHDAACNLRFLIFLITTNCSWRTSRGGDESFTPNFVQRRRHCVYLKTTSCAAKALWKRAVWLGEQMFHSHSAAFQTDYLLQSSSRLAPHVGSPIITLSFAGADLPTHSRVRRLFVFAPLRGRSARNYSKPTCCTPTYIQAFTSSHRRLCKAKPWWVLVEF